MRESEIIAKGRLTDCGFVLLRRENALNHDRKVIWKQG